MRRREHSFFLIDRGCIKHWQPAMASTSHRSGLEQLAMRPEAVACGRVTSGPMLADAASPRRRHAACVRQCRCATLMNVK